MKSDTSNNPSFKKPGFGRKLIRLLLLILFFLYGLLLTLYLLILVCFEVPAVQRFIVQKATDFLENKIGTKVEIGALELDFPETIQLKNVYLEDQNQDTLFYTQRIRVEIALGQLAAQRINLKEISVHRLRTDIHRDTWDSTFNFMYILDAFSSDTAEPDTVQEESNWSFKIGKVNLSDIQVQFHDSVSQNYVEAQLGHLSTQFNRFNLNDMRFHMGDILLEDTDVLALLATDTLAAPDPADTLPSSLPDIRFRKALLSNISATYHDKITGQQLEANIPSLSAQTDRMNLSEKKVHLEHVRLDSIFLSYRQQPPLWESADTIKTSTDTLSWDILLKRTEIGGSELIFHDNRYPEAANEFDVNHVELKKLNLRANDFVLDDTGMEADLEHVSLVNKDEIELVNLNGLLFVGSEEIRLDKGELITEHSRVTSHRFQMRFPDPESFGEKMGTLGFDVNWEDGVLDPEDVFYFAPTLRHTEPFHSLQEEKILFEMKGKGTLAKLKVERFEMNTLENTVLRAKGLFKNLDDPDRLFMELELKEFSTTQQDLKQVVADSLWPENLNVPEQIRLAGQFNGTFEEFITKLNLKTSLGEAYLEADYAGDNKAVDDFDMRLELLDFELGKFLQDSTLGRMSLDSHVEGKGLLKGKPDWTYKLFLPEFEYQDHVFTNIRSDGGWLNDSIRTLLTIKDPWLTMEMQAGVRLDSPQYIMGLDLDLKKANLNALGFYPDSMSVKTDLSFRGTWQDQENFEAHLDAQPTVFYNAKDTVKVDTLRFDGVAKQQKVDFSLNSTLADGHLKGRVDPAHIPQILEAHLNEYFKLRGRPEIPAEDQPTWFTFDFQIKDSRPITKLFAPDLYYLKDGGVRGEYDSREKRLEIYGNLFHVIYTSQYAADSLHYEVVSSPQKMDVNIRAARVMYDSTFIYFPEINGELKENKFRLNMKVPDQRFQDRVFYMLGGEVESSEDAYTIRFSEGEVILHNDLWQVSPDNYIKITDEGILSNQVTLQHENESLTFEATEDNLFLKADSLELRTFARYLTNDDTTKLIAGQLDGKIRVMDYKGKPALQSDLFINDFSVQGATLGDLTLKVVNPKPDFFRAHLDILSDKNKLILDGVYFADRETNALDLTFDVDLDLSTLEPAAQGKLSQIKGHLKGALDVQGTLAAPLILGNLKFKKTGFNVVPINTYFTLDNEVIAFDRKGIAFQKLTITDPRGKPFVLDGHIYTKDYSAFNFDLNITADDFQAINSTKADNEFYYGKLLVDVDMDVTGTLDQPNVDATIKFQEGTDLTYVNYEKELRTVGSEGVVNFVDYDAPVDSALLEARKRILQDTLKSRLAGLDLKTNLIIDEATRFTVITDPLSDNYLFLQGGGELGLKMNRVGNMAMDGTYIIEDGVFHLSFYNLIQEDFNIKPKSRVIFQGDPEDATVDLTAIVQKRARPLPLLTYFGTVLSDEEKTIYQRRLNFEVNLILKGELLDPRINFALGLDEIDVNRFPIVDANLARLNENRNQDLLEKQVFSLLVFGGFISNDPQTFSGTVNNAARNSINSILSNQLNSLSDKFIKGVDVSFELDTYQDYSEGGSGKERTKLGVQLSKQFIDNRLSIQVGGRFDLTGLSDQEKQSLRDIAGDVAVIYAFTKNRRWRTKAYRRLEFDALDGDIVTTGISLIYIKEFNKFKSKKVKNPEKKLKKELKKMK